MENMENRYLDRLSDLYPTIAAASTEIINLQAILNLPKGTEHFLTDAKQFNTTRNMYGYTGYYQGKRVSVMGTGMGCPSMGIYSYELIHFY